MSVNVLLVEDDEIDQMAVQRALENEKIANPIFIAKDGVEALEMLRGENGKQKLSQPILILLDLNMPRMNGIEFLKELRRDPVHGLTIVFILTTSTADEDRAKSYKSNISGYMAKSDVGPGFVNVVKMLDSFWRVVEFP